MSRNFNQRNGLKPARKRQATHASALASSAQCPVCRCRHVIRCQAQNTATEFMCANGHFFDLPNEATT